MESQSSILDPFGKPDCETEVRELKDGYEAIFFDETPFNGPALDSISYLISGRRGSGKTALSKFFSFQKRFPNAHLLAIDALDGYQDVLTQVFQLSHNVTTSRQLAIQQLTRFWEIAVWSLIVRELTASTLEESGPKALRTSLPQPGSLDRLFRNLKELLVPNDQLLSQTELAEITRSEHFIEVKNFVYRVCEQRPLIITIDTLEQYEVKNLGVMYAIAALIDFAAVFNSENRDRGLHLKVLVAGEVLPYLLESIILNPLKSVRHPVHLLWRPRDLLRLICWRLYRKLQRLERLSASSRQIGSWDNYKEVHMKMWVPYFGETVENRHGRPENSFSYVLRHTQMRPRQLICLCNAIANRSIRAGRFPNFSAEDIREGVWEEEDSLAVEIINSYSAVYPSAGNIMSALTSCPMVFVGSELDRRAKRTRQEWLAGDYSLPSFRQLVTEMGVVGRVKRKSSEGFIDAEFDYASPKRLVITSEDECAIHPMFYQRLNINGDGSIRVMPFASDGEVA
jgi:hypothetical protein